MPFIRLADGTTLESQSDGSYRPIETMTDHAYLDGLSDAQIDELAASDPDHPGLDDAFWTQFDEHAASVPTIRLEADVLDFFQRSGTGYETRINAVLRDYVASQHRLTGSH